MCSWVHLETKEVKTCKPHNCVWCGHPIPTGFRVIAQAAIGEDGKQRIYFEHACFAAMEEDFGNGGDDCFPAYSADRANPADYGLSNPYGLPVTYLPAV